MFFGEDLKPLHDVFCHYVYCPLLLFRTIGFKLFGVGLLWCLAGGCKVQV